MGDFENYGGSEEENAEIKHLYEELKRDEDNFEVWEKLVAACQALEGGLNRNSSPQALATLRETFDRFLNKFPLLFGYWKKYADLEFTISGPESAEMVYERGCASIAYSVDLWTDYCSFKMETTHDPALVRDCKPLCNRDRLSDQDKAIYNRMDTALLPSFAHYLAFPPVSRLRMLQKCCLVVAGGSFVDTQVPSLLFERAARYIGLDFLAHVFWDKYLEYEERQEAHDKVFALLKRVIHIPLHQYARYFDRYSKVAVTRPLSELVSSDVEEHYRAEVLAEAAQYGLQKSALEIERDIRAKIDVTFYEIFHQTQAEVTKRWTHESELKRPYFHVKELDHEQLAAWRKYLDFEEKEGDRDRILYLYERCMSICALYDEFWFRYARWMLSQEGKEEEVRNIYLRAAIFVPISRPGIRLQFAYFEEMQGRIDVARDIYAAVLDKLPDAVEVITSWGNMERRQIGLDAAIQVYKQQIDSPLVDLFTKADLVTEWAFLLWKVKGSVEEARMVYVSNVQWYADSRQFWQKWLEFELEQPTNIKTEAEQGERIRNVFREMRSKSRISDGLKMELTQYYLNYLQQRGGKDAMKEFLTVDAETFGPQTVSIFGKAKALGKETAGELDSATRLKAEARYYAFYQLHSEPDPNAQGPADYN